MLVDYYCMVDLEPWAESQPRAPTFARLTIKRERGTHLQPNKSGIFFRHQRRTGVGRICFDLPHLRPKQDRKSKITLAAIISVETIYLEGVSEIVHSFFFG